MIEGYCDPRFERVKEAFAENFRERDEIGASVSVVLDGKLRVDLWGGFADAERARPWQRDTLVNVWSLGKAMCAFAVLKLMDSGVITPESRVANAWPEFAAGGKADVTFATLMSHRAGLCAVAQPVPEDAFLNWDLMTGALAAQAPWWEPGTAHGYHTNTFGYLLGEPVRRLTGTRLKDYFQQHIAMPLGADFQMGVDARDVSRCADLVHQPRPADAPSPVPSSDASDDDPLVRMRKAIYGNPPLSAYDFNSADWRMAEFPSTNPQSNARAVATIFGEMARVLTGANDGVLSREILDRARQIESDGEDLNVQRPTRFGLGLQLTQPVRPFGPNEGSFGHFGNGGHVGFADPVAGLGFAYHMNHQGYAWRDPRNIALIDATYEALA